MPGGRNSAAVPYPVHEEGQPAGSRDPGIQLAQGARGGIARVGKQAFARFLPGRVQADKNILGHVSLAPHLQGWYGPAQPEGNTADGFQVSGDILTGFTVTPGSPPDKETVFVIKGNRQSVDLRLHHILDLLPRQGLPYPPVKIPQFPFIEGVGQAQHRGKMAQGRKTLPGPPADPLGG